MGGIVSKISPDINFDRSLNESLNKLKNTFDGTPKYKIIDDKMIDPRSATLEIHRTPLCLLDVPDDEGNTPIVRNRKKSKRRSSRISDVELSRSDVASRSFEFSSTFSGSESKIMPWDPRNEALEPDLPTAEMKDHCVVENNYEVVVEELRECLGKVTMTPVYIDNDSYDGNINTPPPNKDVKKLLWTPDHALTPKSPVTKERTPLGLVNSNLASQRLSVWRGAKVWRGPADERAKLQGENTPPLSLPPFGSPKSAPPTSRHLHFSLK